jgi:tetratricopeptide (TPR) repeat protein
MSATRLFGVLVIGLALAVGMGCATGDKPKPKPKPTAAAARTAPQPTDAQRRARMHYEIGIERLRTGRNPEAIGELLQAVRLTPNDKAVRLAIAEAYRRGGRVTETEQHLKAALEIDPEFQQAHLNLSALYIQLEQYEAAIPHCQRLLEDATFPHPWRALTNLGWAELKLGRLDGAAEHLGLALDYRDDYWPARLNLGILDAERGRRTEAIANFERVLVAQPGPYAEAEVRYRLAEQYESLGDRKAAVAQLTKAADLRPSGPWSKRSAEYLESLR